MRFSRVLSFKPDLLLRIPLVLTHTQKTGIMPIDVFIELFLRINIFFVRYAVPTSWSLKPGRTLLLN